PPGGGAVQRERGRPGGPTGGGVGQRGEPAGGRRPAPATPPTTPVHEAGVPNERPRLATSLGCRTSIPTPAPRTLSPSSSSAARGNVPPTAGTRRRTSTGPAGRPAPRPRRPGPGGSWAAPSWGTRREWGWGRISAGTRREWGWGRILLAVNN